MLGLAYALLGIGVMLAAIPELGHGLALSGVTYGVLVWGFAMYWLSMAIALTSHAKA